MLQVLDFTEVFWHSIYHKIPNKDLSLWIHTVHRLWIDSRESSTDSGNFLSVSEYVDTDYRDTARTFDSNSSAQFKNPSSSIFFTLKSWEVHRSAQSRPPSLPSSCFLSQSEQSYISPSSGSGSMTWIPRITRKIRTYMVPSYASVKESSPLPNAQPTWVNYKLISFTPTSTPPYPMIQYCWLF